MSCRKFQNLQRIVQDLGLPNNTSRFFVNKLSRIIKKADFDIYEVRVSMDCCPDAGVYVSHDIIDSVDGTLYITFIID